MEDPTSSSATSIRTNDPIMDAREELNDLFQQGGFWHERLLLPSRGEYIDASRVESIGHSHQNMVEMASNAIRIVDLLRSYPQLAAERFSCRLGSFCYHPLTIFVLNNFDPSILDIIYQLYPYAVTKPRQYGSQVYNNLLDVACHAYFISDRALFWLISKHPELLSVYDHNRYGGCHVSPLGVLLHTKQMQMRGTYVSLPVLKAFLEQGPDMDEEYQARQPQPFIEMLFSMGYGEDILLYVMSLLPKDYDTLRVRQSYGNVRWELGLPQARVVAKFLPRLVSLELSPYSWTVEAWVYMLHTIVSSNNQLEKLTLTLPVSWLLSHQDGLQALQEFFQRKDPTCSLQTLELRLADEEKWEMDPTFLQKATENCFQSIIQKGTMKAPDRGISSLFQQLTLVNFSFSTWQIIASVGTLTSSLTLQDIHITRGEDGTDSRSLRECWNQVVKSSSTGSGVQRHVFPATLTKLKMKRVQMTPTSFIKLWQNIRLPMLRHLIIQTGDDFDGTCIPQALKAMARKGLASLEVIELKLPRVALDEDDSDNEGNNNDRGDNHTVRGIDLTPGIVALLQGSSKLKELRVKGTSDDDGYDHYLGPSYRVELPKIVPLLEQNTALCVLELKEFLGFCGDGLQETPRQLSRMLKSNTLLNELTLYDFAGAYTTTELPMVFRDSYAFVDYRHAEKIQYALSLNQFGRRVLRDSRTTLPQFFALLVNALQSRLKGCPPKPSLAVMEDRDGKSLASLNEIFSQLMSRQSAIKQLSRNIDYQTETLGIMYGLLRESPQLWCSIGARASGGKGKRKNPRREGKRTTGKRIKKQTCLLDKDSSK